jgi:SET domain-containing protein
VYYFRLKPSAIAGVGVFATSEIPQGTQLRELFGDDVRRCTLEEFAALELPAEIKEHLAIRYESVCYLPVDLNRISVGWYLNHSAVPNLAHDANYDYYTLRDIAAGEELLIDYNEL